MTHDTVIIFILFVLSVGISIAATAAIAYYLNRSSE